MNRTNIRNRYTFVIKSGIIREAIRETAESGQTNRLDLQTEHTEGDIYGSFCITFRISADR